MISLPVKIETEAGKAELVFEVFEEDGRMICGIYYLTAKINLPPKAWLRALRHELTKLQDIARSAGCVEMRLRGRDWSRVLPDFEFIEGMPNGLRKVLE